MTNTHFEHFHVKTHYCLRHCTEGAEDILDERVFLELLVMCSAVRHDHQRHRGQRHMLTLTVLGFKTVHRGRGGHPGREGAAGTARSGGPGVPAGARRHARRRQLARHPVPRCAPLLSLSALLLPIVAILTPLHWAFAAGRLHLSMDPWLRAATVGGVCCEGILLMCVSPGQKAALRIACAVVRPHNTPDANFLCLSR